MRAIIPWCLAVINACAWNPPVDTAGPVTAKLQAPASVVSVQPFTGTLTIINDSSRDVSGTYELRGIDGWTIAPADAAFTAAANQQAAVPFTVTPAEKTYSAHYPIHAFVRFEQDGAKYTAHPIAIVETKLPIRGARSTGSVGLTPKALKPATLKIADYTVVVGSDGRVLFRRAGTQVGFEVPVGVREILSETGALRMRVSATGDVHLGPWTAQATRIYAGQGNVIDHPEAFNLGADGHRLATRFVGFDFPGMSILEATDVPPDHLEVNPAERRYTLHAHHDQMLTFIPAPDIWTALLRWREINGQHAAPGVPKLAGRFVFDLWDGKYADRAAQLRRSFRYGLTDSVVIWHNWQRWGYDYRLPDIWPPNPEYGSLDEFRDLAKMCKDAGVLFAPHDNYIDFYPDAEGFSYSRIARHENGEPWRAWDNHWRGAQSYRWRADSFQPFLERNLRVIRDNVAPNAYFVDVWSSMGPFDHWTEEGRLISTVETQRAWGEAFARIRQVLGGAVTISEAGHDNLIGWLDGATSVHLRVAAPPQRGMVWSIKAEGSERIPWMDAVNHDRFIQHGAGYEERYTEGLDKKQHGIYSDDYISTEVMTGHPAMVPEAFSRDAVRVYWLLHDLARALAMQHITAFEFADGNLHRQHITWSNGEVWVNRGAEPWTIAGHTLPQYGYYARAGDVESAIETVNGRREWSHSPIARYEDGYRVDREEGAVRVTPLPDSGRMDIRLNWRDLPWQLPEPTTMESVNEDDRGVEKDPVRHDGSDALITTSPNRFAYRLR